MTAYIRPVANHYGLYVDGFLTKEYTRARDARRGAKRMGITAIVE